MTTAHQLRRLGNSLYRFGFPIYRPLYRTFKAYADRSERALLRSILGEGSVVIDAGANIGVYSEFIADCVGRTGAVHSFEPEPQNCARLRAALAHLENIRINEMALSDQTGTSVLYLSEELNVDHRAYPSTDGKRNTLSIETIRLDDYLAPQTPVDLVKLDIQGFELHALRGAEQLLHSTPSINLLFEYWPYGLKQAGASGEELLSYLLSRGFKLSEISSSGLTRLRSSPVTEDPDSYFNIFASR